MNIEKKNKIAIFDLDGTIWKVNSHIEILNAYFRTDFYTSFFYRGLCHFFRKSMYHFICKKYQKIPKDFVLHFEPQFNSDVLAIIDQKKREGWFVLIISNAPYEIVLHAAERLGLFFLSAPIGHKKEILDMHYSYTELFVCSDNVEDIDLFVASQERKIIWTKYNTDFFYSKGFIKDDVKC